MKRALFIFLAVIILIGIGAAIYAFTQSTPDAGSLPPPQVTFPTATSTQTGGIGSTTAATLTFQTTTGDMLTVQNFIQTPGVVVEPYTEREYVLVEDCSGTDVCVGAATSTGFRIVYDDRNVSFNVLLLTEPLRESRLRAGQYLAQLLGISTTQLCSLTASVGTINSVNGTYAGQELGFAGCTNSVLLP